MIIECKKMHHSEITSHKLTSFVNDTCLLYETVSSIIQMNKGKDVGIYSLLGRFGVEGSGSHKIRQQLIHT